MFDIIDYPSMLSSKSSRVLSEQEKEDIRKLYEWVREELKKYPVKIIVPRTYERQK